MQRKTLRTSKALLNPVLELTYAPSARIPAVRYAHVGRGA